MSHVNNTAFDDMGNKQSSIGLKYLIVLIGSSILNLFNCKYYLPEFMCQLVKRFFGSMLI